MSANTTIAVPKEVSEIYKKLEYPLGLTKPDFPTFAREAIIKGIEETRKQVAELRKIKKSA